MMRDIPHVMVVFFINNMYTIANTANTPTKYNQ